MYENIYEKIYDDNKTDYEYSSPDHRFNYIINYYKINTDLIMNEIYRYICLDSFKNNINKKLKKLKLKSNYDNLFEYWLISQNKNNIDPVLPDGKNLKNKNLMFNISNYENISLEKSKEIIKKLDLEKMCQDMIAKMISLQFDNTISEPKVILYEYEINEIPYSKFQVNMEINKNIKSFAFSISRDRYNMLYKKYKKTYDISYSIPTYSFINFCFILILRYNIFYSYNKIVYISYKFYNYISNKYKFNFEIFASSLNTYSNNYCSRCNDIEKLFNSICSYTNIEIATGMYICNPPFSFEIIENIINNIINKIDSANQDIGFILFLPILNKYYYTLLEIIKSYKNTINIVKIKNKKVKVFDYLNYEEIDNPLLGFYIVLIQNKRSKDKYEINLENLIEKYWIDDNFWSNKKNQFGGEYKHINNLTSQNIKVDKNIKLNFRLEKTTDPKLNYPNEDVKNFFIEKAFSLHYMNVDKNSIFRQAKKILLAHFYLEWYKKTENSREFLVSYTLLYNINLNYKYRLNNNVLITFITSKDAYLGKKIKKLIFIKAYQFYFLKKSPYKLHIHDINSLIYTYDDLKVNLVNKDIKNFRNYYDFIFSSGAITPDVIRSISIFRDLVNVPIFFIRLYIVLFCQRKNGSAIFGLHSNTCQKVIREIIYIFSIFYEDITLYKYFEFTEFNYIILKNFRGIKTEDLNNIKFLLIKIYDEYPKFGMEINIHNNKIRDTYNVSKPMKDSDNLNFINSILKNKLPADFMDKIKSFEMKSFNKMKYKTDLIKKVMKYIKEGNQEKIDELKSLTLKETVHLLKSLDLEFV